MKKTTPLAALCLVLMLASVSFATPLVEVTISNQDDLRTLQQLGLDLVAQQGLNVQLIGWEKDLQRLSEKGFTYTIREENLELKIRTAMLNARTEAQLAEEGTDVWSLGLYPGYADILAWRDALAQQYPDLVRVEENIGTTIEGRAMWAIKISDNVQQDEDEPEIFLNGAIHAREVITPLLLMSYADTILARYTRGDSRTVDLVDSREIWIMPVINIDGYLYNEGILDDSQIENGGVVLWRKNRRHNPDDSYGVDLNRNFPFKWGCDDEGSSSYMAYETYRGLTPASEPETQAIMNFVNDHHFTGVLNYHSFGNSFIYPWTYSYDQHEDYSAYRSFGLSLRGSLNWAVGAAEVAYICNGTASDWQAAGSLEGGPDYPMWAFTIEVGDPDGSENYFWPLTEESRDRQVNEQTEPIYLFCEQAPYAGINAAPPTPNNVQITIDSDSLRLAWHSNGDHLGNVSQRYQVIEYDDLLFDDEVRYDDYSFWKVDGFERVESNNASHSIAWYTHIQDGSEASLTSLVPLPVDRYFNSFSLDCSREIYADWYGQFYAQISLDGKDFVTLIGPDTDSNGHIHPPFDEWDRVTFNINDYIGKSVYFKLILIARYSDLYDHYADVYIDNVSPVIGYKSTILHECADSSLTIPAPELEYYSFQIRGIDAEGDVSPWSTMCMGGAFYDESNPERRVYLPNAFLLLPAYPNPFNSSARIHFELNSPSLVNLSVVDVLGRVILDQSLGTIPAGHKQYLLEGKGLASGVFFVRISGMDSKTEKPFSGVQKVVLIR